MLLVDTFRFIKLRDDWYRVLDEAIAETFNLLNRGPDPYLESILAQLDAMKRWTADGREPTEAERKSMTIPMILTREFGSPSTDEIYNYTEKVKEVWFYFDQWLDDATFTSIDSADLEY